MAEPINLDDLLDKGSQVETQVESTPDVTPSEESVENTETQTEDAGEDTIENTEQQNDVVQTEENEETDQADEEVYVKTDGSSEEATEPAIQDSTDEPKSESTEYKFKDDFIKKAVDYYEKYGTLQPFLEATQVDYDAVPDEQLLRLKFDKENADLSVKARDRMFQKELEKYNLDSYEEDDVEIGQALLKRDANRLRQSFKDEQSQFLQSIQPNNQEQIAAQTAEFEAQQAKMKEVAETGISSVLKDNFIKVAANGEGINFQVANPKKVVDFALDSTQFLSNFSKGDGSIDWDKWVKVVAFTENPDLFVGELIKHGKSLGRKAMEAELKNVTPSVKSKAVIQDSELSDNPYDDKVGFLRGMTVTRK
jgi:hypothetical protein